jgi:hypothetical protein
MAKAHRVAIVALLPFAFRAASGAVYYVSTSGSESNNGLSVSTAFRTLSRAQQAMRASQCVKTAVVLAGTYSIASGVFLTSSDSGESWVGYPGNTVILEGNTTGNIDLDGASNITIQGFQIQNMSATGLPYARRHDQSYNPLEYISQQQSECDQRLRRNWRPHRQQYY